MRYLVDISPKQVQLIQKYLERGSYGSLSQFIGAAIENQLTLEENDVNELIPYRSTNETNKDSIPKELSVGNSEKYSLVNILPFNGYIDAPGFENLVFSSQSIPENEIWLWGQINKIFPVKLGLRILHQLLAEKQSIELNDFLNIVADEAGFISKQIRGYELKTGKMRDEKISAALPDLEEKSQNRYKFQFMVYLRKDGKMDGAMALMKFCNVYMEKKKQMIGITEQGLKFSSIDNPVLDHNDFDKSLSEEESLFYIHHIKENVKGEYAAIKWMLEKIKSGKNDRESLNEEIEKTFRKKWGEKTTDAVISTQRAGITARMFELGLIEKEKDGIYVKYGVSELGSDTLKK